jgi:hypothetical protein
VLRQMGERGNLFADWYVVPMDDCLFLVFGHFGRVIVLQRYGLLEQGRGGFFL